MESAKDADAVTEYLPLVFAISGWFAKRNRNVESGDFSSEAFISLTKALSSYKPNPFVSLKHHVARTIRRDLVRFANKENGYIENAVPMESDGTFEIPEDPFPWLTQEKLEQNQNDWECQRAGFWANIREPQKSLAVAA